MASTPRSRTPAGTTGRASPEVRAALAAMKAKRPTPARHGSSAMTIKLADDLDALGLPSIRSVVDKAKSTGRCNIASRSLDVLPAELFETLLPRTSMYHPSNRAPKHFALDAIVDLSIGDRDDESARWYEAKELTILKASSNELEAVDEAVSGFASLESLDLHHNRLTCLPTQLAQLGNLTYLKLSRNRFESIPLQLLALDALTELDLSDNCITSLWPPDWRGPLRELLTDEDDTVSPDTSAGSDFWSAFPSSPTKPRKGVTQQTVAPFPSLKTLNLAKNRLRSETLATEGFVFPENLQRVDLSSNSFATPIPLSALQSTRHLVSLELQGNELAEPVFCDRDPLRDAFAALREIDLSSNAIDDLSALEALFAHRSAQWLGLPKTVPQHAPPTAAGGLRVKLAGNPLRNEAARRRAAKAAALAKPTPVRGMLGTRPVAPIEVPPRSEVCTEPEMPSFTIHEDESDVKTPVAATFGAISVLRDAMDASGAVSLVGRSLAELPLDFPSTVQPTPTAIDASRNALTSLPLGHLASQPWSSTLRTLTLTRNRLAALAFSENPVALPALTALDLSSNRLANPDGALLAGIAAICPALEHLDLNFNSLVSLAGVASLLLPSAAAGARGLRTLKLGSNQLDDLSPLVGVALRIRGADGAGWACDELDLRDNSIAKLPPELGLLPVVFLGVSGNVFRVPQRKVYEDGGSTAVLLKWLKDRL